MAIQITARAEGRRTVEKAHTTGWWPNLYEPTRGLGEKVTDFKNGVLVLKFPKVSPPKDRTKRIQIRDT